MRACTTSQEALKMVEQRPYNLVICDLQMPGEEKEEKTCSFVSAILTARRSLRLTILMISRARKRNVRLNWCSTSYVFFLFFFSCLVCVCVCAY